MCSVSKVLKDVTSRNEMNVVVSVSMRYLPGPNLFFLDIMTNILMDVIVIKYISKLSNF